MTHDQLDEYIERELPEWRKAVRFALDNKAEVLMHPSAFGMREDEFLKLGAALKYAWELGVTVNVAVE